MKTSPILLLALMSLLTPPLHAADSYDVAVFGATSGGVIAAVQSARMGKTVVLLDPGKHVGGMTSSGLGWIDIKGTASVGGLAREFFDRVGTHYAAEKIDLKQFGNEGWTVEPHVAENIFQTMLSAAKVPFVPGFRLAAVTKNGPCLAAIQDETGRAIHASMFIDATYEGDLMARAKVSYTVGRESRQQYDESYAGIRPEPPDTPTRALKIDPYLTPGDPASGLLPLVQPGAVGDAGAASDGVQSYNYRLCLTRDPDNRIPILPPPDYDPKRYELFGRFFTAAASTGQQFTLRQRYIPNEWFVLKIDPIAHGKTDTNNAGRFSTDYLGFSHDYAEANYAAREKIARAHENYMRGFLHFVATDPRVPENVREEMKSWGLAKDEFQDTGGWPFQLYVREARRMIGEYVMTQHDTERSTHVEDSAGMASYMIDSHSCRRLVDNGIAIVEGGFARPVPGPYPVSYRALVPKAADCENLLVPACCSASHVAYASVRMEPVFMILGQSCGTAAAHAIDEKTPVQNIDIKKLQTRLLADKQILDLPAK